MRLTVQRSTGSLPLAGMFGVPSPSPASLGFFRVPRFPSVRAVPPPPAPAPSSH
jgi:hypothetical protein